MRFRCRSNALALRTIAVGTGNEGELALPYLPGNADVKEGDLLVTSGMGGVFPQGYPVAKVTEVHREAVQPLAQVRAAPLAHIDRDREVMLVWFRDGHPAAPVRETEGDLTDRRQERAAASGAAEAEAGSCRLPRPEATTGAGCGDSCAAAATAAGALAQARHAPCTPATPGQSGAGPRNTVPTPTRPATGRPTTNPSSAAPSADAARPAASNSAPGAAQRRRPLRHRVRMPLRLPNRRTVNDA